ncbi:MAG: carbohydrate ABC transporter permease [Clostridiales bacterium]|nr:carbohydrate ABC transporter permease [Clostridiales bacterium]
MKISNKGSLRNMNKDKFRKLMLGSKDKEGILKMTLIYLLLISIGFIYIYPILHMVSTSFMTLDDLLDSSINWIPSSLNLSNYMQAAKSMDFWKSFLQSVIIAGLPTLCNMFSCALIGYGLARFEFPFKKVILAIIIFSFILPDQITMIPTYVLYSNIGILGTIWGFILPAILGMGINAQIYILIFYYFFQQIPNALIEAAQVDGVGYFQSFLRVSIPSSVPAFITVGLFSFVWYWNNSYLTQMYVTGVLQESGWTTLVVQLKNFSSNYSEYAVTANTTITSLNESINMSGTVLSILPLLVLYLVFQKYFVESVDRSGITGE